MKNTFFASKDKARIIMITVIGGFILFGGAMVFSLIEGMIFLAIFFALFTSAYVIAYIKYRQEGMLDRVKIEPSGITVLRGIGIKIEYIEWDNISSIKRVGGTLSGSLKIQSEATKGNKPYILYIDRSYETDNLIDKYYYDRPEYELPNKKPQEKKISKKMNLPQYAGKRKFLPYSLGGKLVLIFGISVFSLLVVLLLTFDSTGFKGLDFLIEALLIIMDITVLLSIDRSIYISSQGVKYKDTVAKAKNKFFAWEEINTIGIGVYPYGTRPTNGFLYFCTRKLENDLAFEGALYLSDTISVKYSPKLVHCVLQYWDEDILNLDKQKNWVKYLDRIGRA